MEKGRNGEHVIPINKVSSVYEVFMNIIPVATISRTGHYRKTRVERRGKRLAADYGDLKWDSPIDVLPVRSLVIRPYGDYVIRV